MRKYFLNIAVLLSIISIIATIIINIEIAKEYLRVDGKTRALFGIKELFQFGFQYYVSVIGFISFFFALLHLKVKEDRRKTIAAILLSLFTISIVFGRIWRLIVLGQL
ncbi:MAG: hypothetical protein QM725_03575 [Lacibacter sp.]